MLAIVTEYTRLSEDLIKLRVQNPTAQPHRSGQYSIVSLPGVEGQAYFSIASPAFEQPEMTFLIRLGDGALDEGLKRLKVGDAIDVAPPAGRFVPAEDGDALLFLGGGTGIAPMLAMVRELVRGNDPRRIRLVYGYRNAIECAFDDELKALEQAGVIVQRVIGTAIVLDQAMLDGELVRGHICGPKPMIAALQTQAAALGLDALSTEPY
jgi:propane monooxygenase reductase subunit